MNKRISRIITACAALIMTASGLHAGYIIPWYANPSFKSDFSLGSDTADVTTLSIDPSGQYLALGAVAADGFANIQAFNLSKLAKIDSSVAITAFTGSIASSAAGLAGDPVVAIRATATASTPALAPNAKERMIVGNKVIGSVVALNRDLSAAKSMVCGVSQWTGNNAPTALNVSGSDSVSSFAFNKAGTAAWANSTAAGRTGTITEWTFANGTLTKGREIATGLSVVNSLSVYTIGDVEYVVVGEGDSAAATAGQIKRIKASDGSVEPFCTDATHLDAGIVSVKMSHTDYFRPRLYALLTTGDIACYFIRNAEVVWSRTISNSDLLTAAHAAWTAEHAKVCAFEVFPDGGTAAIAYRRNAGDETEASSSVRLALLKHSGRKWIAYGKDDAGNPRQGVKATLTDGEWQLNYAWDDSLVKIGDSTAFGSAYGNDEAFEFLDFSAGVAFKPGDETQYQIARCQNGRSFSIHQDGSPTPQPRVYIPSPNFNNADQFAKGWEIGFEEVVYLSEKRTCWQSWIGLNNEQTQVLIINAPDVTELQEYSIHQGQQYLWGASTRFEDVNFPKLKTLGKACMAKWQATGTLTLPSASSIALNSFEECRMMEAVYLADNNANTLTIGRESFQKCYALKKVRFGGGAQVTFTGISTFNFCPLEEVIFTGNIPIREAAATGVWGDSAAQKIVFAVPRNHAQWEAVINDSAKVKSRLTPAEQKTFLEAHPGSCIPFGILDKSVLGTNNDQYIAYNDQPGGCALTIEKDDFFDDEVTVTSDSDPLSNGSYMPGTTITVTAVPGATGTFRRWYGDIQKEDSTNTSITFTLNENRWIYCRIVHPWTLAQDKKTISNGNFTINCSVANEGNRTLYAGAREVSGLYADNDTGSGVCDLGGAITLAGDSQVWKITSFISNSSVLTGTLTGKGNADALLTPGTLSSVPTSQFMHGSGIAAARSLNMCVFDEPTMTGTWIGWATCAHNTMQRLFLITPKLTEFTGDGSMWSMPLKETDLTWWDLSSMTRIDKSSFAAVDWENYVAGYGVLSLPSMRTLTGVSLQKMKNVEGFVIGGKTKDVTVTSLGDNLFRQDAKLRTVTIYNDAAMTVGGGIFDGAKAMKEIWLQGPAITETAFNKLVSNFTAGATKPVKVYVSRLMPGWTSAGYLDYAPSAEEKSEAPGERVFAVYRGGAAAPSGKALIIHRSGPFDPKGTYLVFR